MAQNQKIENLKNQRESNSSKLEKLRANLEELGAKEAEANKNIETTEEQSSCAWDKISQM